MILSSCTIFKAVASEFPILSLHISTCLPNVLTFTITSSLIVRKLSPFNISVISRKYSIEESMQIL